MKYYTWFRPLLHDFDFAKGAVEAGISGFEAVAWESHYEPEVFQEYMADLERITEELKVGFTVHAPITDIHLGSINRRIRQASFEELKGAMEFARKIGAQVITLHPGPGILAMAEGRWSKEHQAGGDPGKLAIQEGHLVRALKELADLAPDLLFCLENLVFPHEIYRSPEEMQDLLQKVNRTNVRLTLDVGHAVVSGNKPSEFIQQLGEDIFHVHLHDNWGDVDQHLPLGEGNIDYVGVIHALKQLDYEGVVMLEFGADPARYGEYVRQFK